MSLTFQFPVSDLGDGTNISAVSLTSVLLLHGCHFHPQLGISAGPEDLVNTPTLRSQLPHMPRIITRVRAHTHTHTHTGFDQRVKPLRPCRTGLASLLLLPSCQSHLRELCTRPCPYSCSRPLKFAKIHFFPFLPLALPHTQCFRIPMSQGSDKPMASSLCNKLFPVLKVIFL